MQRASEAMGANLDGERGMSAVEFLGRAGTDLLSLPFALGVAVALLAAFAIAQKRKYG